MDEKKFQRWLIQDKKMGIKSASDVISRCKRIEKVLCLSIDTATRTEKDLEKLIERLNVESSSYLSPKTNRVFAIAVLRRAARLYYAYKKLS